MRDMPDMEGRYIAVRPMPGRSEERTVTRGGTVSPWIAKRPCSRPGCPHLQPCPNPAHAKHRSYASPQRDALNQFYWSSAWRKLSARVIAEEPMCRLCGNAASREADHILTIRERPDLALERSNLRGACKPCHSRRTRQDMNRDRQGGQLV